MMKKGFGRFGFYLEQVEKLLIAAAGQENPALWLYHNNARTPFFMLEALARLYVDMHNAKKFGKLKELFKLIEDGLGKIDYYQFLSDSFAGNKNIPADCQHYFTLMVEKEAMLLNVMLEEEGWLSKDRKRIAKITERLKEISWMKPAKEMKAFKRVYRRSIASIVASTSKNKYRLNNIEEGVHELRRKLRWLSIYPQALRGAVQYAGAEEVPEQLKKYLTKEILSSPYNVFPAAGEDEVPLLLSKNHFLALSWLIDKLGTLKDEGLQLAGLAEAMDQTTNCGNKKARAWIPMLLGTDSRKMKDILAEAENISRVFFSEKNLEQLLAAKNKEKQEKGQKDKDKREDKDKGAKQKDKDKGMPSGKKQ